MSVSIGELDSEIAVEGGAPPEATSAIPPGTAEASAWAETEKHDVLSRRSRELCERTTAGGFHG